MEENLVKDIGKHTVLKFNLIESYVKEWSQKLANYDNCLELVFIDCMCNCGEYTFNGDKIYGTPIRVTNILNNVASQHVKKKFTLYFNDYDKKKIDYLNDLLPKPKSDNLSIKLSAIDANQLLKDMRTQVERGNHTHYFLLYDPFDASIDWEAIQPFLNNWSEVMINHMASDSIRAVKMVKSKKAKEKYEQTYLCDIVSLLPYGSDRNSYEERVSEIIENLRTKKNRDFFVASFPFFNSKNAFEYSLIFCTNNLKGFKLYKKCAWKAFDGYSSNKKTDEYAGQYQMKFDSACKRFFEDKNCYSINNVIEYLYNHFKEKGEIKLDEIWELLDLHPTFPSDGFKSVIKKGLKEEFSVKEKRSKLYF